MPETIFYSTKDGQLWEATILPECGANCVQLTYTGTFAARGAPIKIPLLEDVPLERILQRPTSYGLPILFPYAGRVSGGQFTWQGRTYCLDPVRHGLVRQHPWEIVERSDERIVCQITVTPLGIAMVFPFHFTLRLTYELGEQGLRVSTKATNDGEPFPYTFGFHPYFHCPAGSSLRVPAAKRWLLSEEKFPLGDLIEVANIYDLRLAQVLTSQSMFDDIFTELSKDQQGMVSCSLISCFGETILAFSAKEYPHLCVYTPSGRTGVCLEPYTGAPDAFNHADDSHFGLRVLDSKETVIFEPISICFRP